MWHFTLRSPYDALFYSLLYLPRQDGEVHGVGQSPDSHILPLLGLIEPIGL